MSIYILDLDVLSCDYLNIEGWKIVYYTKDIRTVLLDESSNENSTFLWLDIACHTHDTYISSHLRY